MKLWDSLATFLVLLSAVRTSLPERAAAGSRGRAAESPLELPPVQITLSVDSTGISTSDPRASGKTPVAEDSYTIEEPIPSEFEDVVNFIKVTISRIRRSSSSAVSSPTSSTTFSSPMEKLSSRTRNRREKKKEGSLEIGKPGRGRSRGGKTGRRVRGRGGGGRGHSCMLKQIHLNVSDLGLGYLSSEEMIFKYCSGPCRKSETNYDKILSSLVHDRRLPLKDTPPQACCRPIAFDDDLSFLDDSLIYHTVRRHSARKCGCV